MLFVQVSVSNNEDREHVYRLHHHLCLQCHAPGLVAVTKFKTTKINFEDLFGFSQKLQPMKIICHTVFGTYGASLHPLGGARSPGTLQPQPVQDPLMGCTNTPTHLPPWISLFSWTPYSNVDSVLTPLSPTQATHLGLHLHERYPMAHDLSPTIHPSLWQLIPLS